MNQSRVLTIARSYFRDLMLAALLLRADHPHAEVAIAVPDRTTYTALLKRVQASLSVLGIGAYVIDADAPAMGRW